MAAKPFDLLRGPHDHSESGVCRQDRTLLDGEMIVDEDKKSGKQQRRYLVYDMIMLEGEVLIRRPFKVMVPLCLLRRPLKQSWWARGEVAEWLSR